MSFKLHGVISKKSVIFIRCASRIFHWGALTLRLYKNMFDLKNYVIKIM